MAETVRIEIPIQTVDETEPELTNLTQKVRKLGSEAEKAGQKAKESTRHVSGFDKQAGKTERSLAAWAKEKYQILLEAKERISPILSTLGCGLKGLTGKTYRVTLRALDLVTSPVRGILNLLRNPVFQMGTVLGVSIGLMDTIKTYQDFEAAMSQVQAVSGATASEVVKLADKAKEMGATTKFTAQESAEAFNYMAMAGWKTGDMLGGIQGILSLAAASGEDLATTSDIVTDALTAFNMKAADAGRFSDVLAAAASNANTTVSGMGETFKYAGSMAGALGYSIEDVALMTGLMANTGIKGTMAGTALNSIFTRLSTNTNGAADAMSDLGIEFFTSGGNARDLSDVMGELRVATADMTAEQKSQLANTVAGTEAQKGLLAILNASEEDYNKLADAINNADGAAAQMSKTMMDNLQGSITLLQSAVDGVKLSFGERLSPYIRNLADWLAAQMPAVEQGLNEFMDWLDTRIDRLQRKWQEITSTGEWQDADFFGKVHIVWDEFIAEPFSEWWNSTGKAKFAGFARDIGSGIGTGLKTGIMAMLGIDLGETVDEGVSIGASFAKGFSEGFDFRTVSSKLWEGFGNLLSDAGKLMPGGEAPDLCSIFSAVMLGKIATPFISMGRGAASIGKGLFGTNVATGTSLMGSLLGSAAAGTGLLGKSGLLAINLGAGNLAGGGSMSAAALSATGMAAGGGAVAAGATLVSGALDAYKAFKSKDKEEAKAYKESAAWKVGGVATGSAVGAAVGSVLPGIGTVIGTLVGGGIGGIAGWIKGNKAKEEYQVDLEVMQREAERAQKVFVATGTAIEDAGFKNEALTEAMNDSGVSAEQFALMFQEECANVAKKAFGDISLSLAEVKKLAKEITFADMAGELDGFIQAASDTGMALRNLQSSISRIKKENWKVSFGMELSETDKDGYKSAVEDFLDTSQTFIDDNHYEATMALKLLAGGEADSAGLDSYYNHLKLQLEEWGTKLSDSVTIALEDGVITLDEAAELENLQEQISAITDKLAGARTDAEMQVLQVKHNGAALDIESFHAMMEEVQENAVLASGQYESALTLTLTNLNLRLADGAITRSEYDEAVAEATEGYYAQVNGLGARVSAFGLESIAAAWDSELSKIMPGVEGTTAERLTQALNNALLAHPDVAAWEEADVAKWMGLDKLDLDPAEQNTIAAELIRTALAIPEGMKETLLQDYRDSLPTVEEIVKYLDWKHYSVGSFDKLTEVLMDPLASDGDWDMYRGWTPNDPLVRGIPEGRLDPALRNIATDIRAALEASLDPETVSGFIRKYMTNAMGDGVPSDFPLFRESLEVALNETVASPFTVSPVVNVRPSYHVPHIDLPARNGGVDGHAAGGYVSGGPQLSWLAEEGYGEFIIPTNPGRRSRALELYEQAGVALGVSSHAAGGYVGGPVSSDKAAAHRLSRDAGRNAPLSHNGFTDDDGETASGYPSVPVGKGADFVSTPVQVNVSMAPEFVVQGNGGGQDEEGILQVIKKHMREMADELGGELAVKIEEVFSNMPLKGA